MALGALLALLALIAHMVALMALMWPVILPVALPPSPLWDLWSAVGLLLRGCGGCWR